ncbi:S66 peptidase family protein [Rhizomonospora bruguierae]|uniref:S66 peptidase family protein n=1 Tax=Rhizomonospora bruguierae TaxID=1581705 RepID=UPI001BCAC33D|nr:LD-carboxypeptidase [Micromonospora sp. NBRC 107566]
MSDVAGAEAPVRPAALRPGDTVMLVSPSGPTSPERIARGLELLAAWGLTPKLGPNAYGRHGFLAGTDDLRLADLNAALADPRVRGIICTRGGYGAQRVVDALDMTAARRDPKVVVGFSDITALQLALWRGARLATLHGPTMGWDDARLPAGSADSLRAALTTTEPAVIRPVPAEETAAVGVPGPPVTGTLLGGNLSLLVSSIGTPDLPDLTGAILLLEEVDEPSYKVDRMLTHLRRAGVLSGLAGVAIGQFTGCGDNWGMPVAAVLTDRLGDLGVPVLGGLPVGHGPAQVTVGVGVPATLDVAAGTLTVEPAVR